MLVKQTIKTEVAAAFKSVMNDEGDRNTAIDKVADKIAEAVINAIKSQEITYMSGLIAPTGAVTGVFKYTIT